MTDEYLAVARRSAQVAGDLDRRGYPNAGAVRCAARAVIELAMRVRDLEAQLRAAGPVPPTAAAASTSPAAADRSCKGCGAPVPQPATGRPRTWCSERCRRRARR